MTEYRVFLDGSAWCATGKNFKTIQECSACFGGSPLEALGALIVLEKSIEIDRCKAIRDWKCGCCNQEFSRRSKYNEKPGCTYCKAGNQYVFEVPNVQIEVQAASGLSR